MKQRRYLQMMYNDLKTIADADEHEFDETWPEFIEIAEQCDYMSELAFTYDCDTFVFEFDVARFNEFENTNKFTKLMIEYLELIHDINH